uniref:Uncharacterized protein n=1 Tax=Gopherus agassizii TaxID=38772 RepID=A0A452ISE6_9SAUR
MYSRDRDLNHKGEIDLTEKEEDLSLCLLQSPFLCSPEMYGAERLCRPKSTNSRPAQRLGNGLKLGLSKKQKKLEFPTPLECQ